MKFSISAQQLPFLLVGSLSLLGAACGSSPDEFEDDAADTQDPITNKADAASRPVGTFYERSPQKVSGAMFTRLVLKTDNTYFREDGVLCVTTPCTPIISKGNYKFTKSGRHKYIRFFNQHNIPRDRFAYKFDGSILKLRPVGGNRWTEFGTWGYESKPAWCIETNDCKLQNLITPRCVGRWTCKTDGACEFDCSAGPPAEQTCTLGVPPNVRCGTFCGDAGYKVVDGAFTCECCSDAPTVDTCRKTGCSGQICADHEVFTTCEYVIGYECYADANAKCERQANGDCGWTYDSALNACLGR